jgi:RNA polymerase sigma-70 factor, ECF subfamily
MEHPSLQHLLSRLRANDRSAMHQVFDGHYEGVCQVIYRYVLDPGLSEDLAQEVFIRFWEKRHQIGVESNLAAYLRRMAVNEALAYLRRKTRFTADELPETLALTAAGADEPVMISELDEAVTRAIDSLPPRCRIVFQLSRFEEMTYPEIAARLDISVKTVENQMGKALRVLREKLEPYVS